MYLILNTTKLVEIYIACDDFAKKMEQYQLSQNQDIPKEKMSCSEIMTIVIYYHLSGMKCFKYYYQSIIKGYLKSYFTNSYTYENFVTKMQCVASYLWLFLQGMRLSFPTEANYIDATKLVVCHNKRIHSHRVFAKLASRGKSSLGWFFGFKVHAVINQMGQLVVFEITTGKVADNNPELLKSLTSHLACFLYGDKGYITALREEFAERNLYLITKLRANMKKNQVLTEQQSYYLKHRGLIETVFDVLKNQLDIEHSRHRSPKNFLINLLAGLLAYTFLEKTPSITSYPQKLEKSQIVLIQEDTK